MKRVAGGGEAGGVVRVVSESSPGSSFRELDDVFLQTQARIWLGEVLHLRFDEETSMADLISDGELLFQVSKILWKKLVKKHPDLNHSELHIYERTSSGKNDGRYLRYTKVDSFLKICQILGLKGVDLFTPSDVVDKRDTRKVCMCIRSLSMKSHSENLPVPDFDVVTYTIAMPNYMVGGICRDLLERSKSSNSNSSFRQKDELHYDSDEAESCLSEIEFETPKSNSNSISQFDVIQSDLHEEIGENFTEISEEKQRNSVSDSNPISEKEISEINMCNIIDDLILASTSSCESSVGDSWQGQDGNFTPDSKLVMKNEVETEMDNSSNIISDGDKNSINLMNSSNIISDGEENSLNFEMEKNEDNFTEELIKDLIREYDDPNLESENVREDLNTECEIRDLNSGDSTVQNAEKIGDSEFSSENKFTEEFDDPNLDNIIADFCEKIGTGNEVPDLNSESQILDLNSGDLDYESEVRGLNLGDLTGQNVGKIDNSEFSSSQQNVALEIELEEQGEEIEEELIKEKDKVVNPIERVSTSTEVKADYELETEKVTEERENEDEISEGNSRNKVQNQNLGQKVFTSVAGGVTLAGVLLIFLQMRKRSKERNEMIGLQSPIKKAKEETNERNNMEIKKPKAVYPTEWLKI